MVGPAFESWTSSSSSGAELLQPGAELLPARLPRRPPLLMLRSAARGAGAGAGAGADAVRCGGGGGAPQGSGTRRSEEPGQRGVCGQVQ